jgi:hypothetical protein
MYENMSALFGAGFQIFKLEKLKDIKNALHVTFEIAAKVKEVAPIKNLKITSIFKAKMVVS